MTDEEIQALLRSLEVAGYTSNPPVPQTHGELVQEVARLTALVADLAVAGQALLDAAKVGERTFWNAAQQWLAAHARYKGTAAHASNPYA